MTCLLLSGLRNPRQVCSAIALCCVLATVVTCGLSRAAVAASDLRLQSDTQASVVRLQQAEGPARLVGTLTLGAPLLLSPGEAIVVSARFGEQFTVRSSSLLDVGWGVGAGGFPDAITWDQHGAKDPTLRARTWGSARFLVIALAGAKAAHVRVLRAAPSEHPMELYRLDAAVQEWLSAPDAAPPVAPSEHYAALLRSVASYRYLLQQGAPREHLSPWAGHWLQARWLDLAVAQRPLRAPFFRRGPTVLSGGVLPAPKQNPETDVEDAESTRVLNSGESLRVADSQQDVVTFAVSVRETGRSRVQLWRGDTLLDDVSVTTPRRREDRNRWTAPQVLRATTRGTSPLILRVLAGQASVVVRSYGSANGLLGPADVRQAYQQLTLAVSKLPSGASASLAGLRALLEYELSPTEPQLARLYAFGKDGRLPGALRLLLLDAALPQLLRRADGFEAFRIFDQLSAEQPAAVSGSLRRAAYARLVRGLGEPFAQAWTEAPVAKTDVMSWTDADVAALLFGQVWATADGQRSRLSELGERWAALEGSEAERAATARDSWSRAAPWKLVEPAGQAERPWAMLVPSDGNPDGSCAIDGPRGLRWTLLDEPEQEVDVAFVGGTHTLVRLISPPDAADRSSEWRLGNTLIRVHGGVGSSYSALKPGRHLFSRVQGEAAVARIPRKGTAPCVKLREAERWVVLEANPLRFPLPAGAAATVLSVQAEPESLGGRALDLQVVLGAETRSGMIYPGAIGVLEFPVAPAVSEALVSGKPGTWIRVRVRQHRDPLSPEPQAFPSLTVKARDYSPTAKASVPSQTQLIALSEELRKVNNQQALDDVRLKRAALLTELGFSRYAAHDLSRRSPGATTPSVAEAPVSASEFVTLNGTSAEQAVVPRGVLAMTPLLPQPAAEGPRRARWERVKRLLASERHTEAIHLLSAMEEATKNVTTEALALALSAELSGNSALAAETYQRLAASTGSSDLYARAARVATDAAAELSDLTWARRAFAWAHSAAARGQDVTATLARFSQGLVWETLPPASLGMGRTVIEALGNDEADATVGASVRRALTLAPEHARHFTHSLSYALAPWRGQLMRLDYLCAVDEVGDEPCTYEVVIDGSPVTCLGWGAQEKSHLTGRPSSPRWCEFTVDEDAQALSLYAPKGPQSFGWSNLSVAATQESVPTRLNYSELSGDSPLRVLLAGPAVVELLFRGEGLVEQSVDIQLSEAAGPNAEGSTSRVTRTFQWQPDSLVRWPERSEVVAKEQSHELVLAEQKTYELQITPQSGRVLAIARVARVDALPTTREIVPPEWLVKPSEPSTVRFREFETESSLEPAERDLFSYSLDVAAVDRDLSDTEGDRRDRYIEQRGLVRRELVRDRWWATAGGFARLRVGSPSFGATMQSEVSSTSLWPGAFVRAQWVGQNLGGHLASAMRVSAGIHQRYELASSLVLVPSAGLAFRSADLDARIFYAADHDVYSSFARTRPRAGEAGLALQHSLLADTQARYGVRARSGPEFDAIDQLDVLGRLTTLPGAGDFPWIELDVSLSYRPEYALRNASFIRVSTAPSVTFWRWVSARHRWRLETELNVSSDAPVQNNSAMSFFGGLLLGYDYLSEPGLSDYPPADKPFRQRLEEGAPRSYRGGARAESALGDEP